MKGIKNLLRILVFSFLGLASKKPGNLKYLGMPKKEFNKKTIISKFDYSLSNKLKINNENNFKFVTERDEKETISDMYKELNNSILEESWIFNKNNKIWYETGKHSIFKGDSKGRFIDSSTRYKGLARKIIRETLKEQPNTPQYFVHYHIHPSEKLVRDSLIKIKESHLNNLDNLFEEKKRDNKMYSETSKAIRKAFKGISKARPSIADIRLMFSDEVSELRISPFVYSKHKIRSQYGITEYNLTSKAIEYFVKQGNEILSSRQLKDYDLQKKENGEFFLKNDFLSIHFIPNNALRSYYTNKEKTKIGDKL